MNEEPTPAKVMEQMERAKTVAELDEVIEGSKKALDNLKRSKSFLEGQIDGIGRAVQFMEVLRKRWVDPKPNAPAAAAAQLEKPTLPPEPDQELKERLEKGLCTFKAMKQDGGKWCARKLRDADERRTGYCKIHMGIVGVK